ARPLHFNPPKSPIEWWGIPSMSRLIPRTIAAVLVIVLIMDPSWASVPGFLSVSGSKVVTSELFTDQALATVPTQFLATLPDALARRRTIHAAPVRHHPIQTTTEYQDKGFHFVRNTSDHYPHLHHAQARLLHDIGPVLRSVVQNLRIGLYRHLD